MKTVSINSSQVEHQWYLIDAAGKTLGRLASEVATRLRGKHEPIYTPHVDTGDYIVIVNAEKIGVTGNKLKDKIYYRHSGKPGNLKKIPLGKMLQTRPEQVIELAVKNMLPRNPLGRAMFRKLKVYVGDQHPHTAQNPQPLSFEKSLSLKKV